MFLWWILIYLPLSLLIFNYSDLAILCRNIEWYFLDILFKGESRLAWPLWYLYSSMIAYFLLSLLSRYKSGDFAAILLAALFVAGRYAVPWLTLPPTVAYCAEGFFIKVVAGFPYVLTGLWIFKYSDRLINISFASSMLAISGILYYFGLGGIFYTFLGGMGIFVISYIIILPDNSLYKSLNAIGIWMYLTHMFNLIIIKELLIRTNISLGNYPLMFTCFLFTFVTSFLLYRLSNAKGFKWLKKLI